MQFLKILFWALLAFVAAFFTSGNWRNVPVRLLGLIAEVNLPLLLLVTFLLGLVPTLLYQHTIRWRQRQRIATLERTLAQLATPSEAVSPEPAYPAAPIPGIVPPGGA